VIAAGGTAGHVVPALAVADALRAEGAEIVFIGGERAEAELVPQAGYRLHTLRMASLPRAPRPVALGRAVAIDVRAAAAARRLLGEIAPGGVLGAGGYVAGPVCLAALTRRIPLVLAEADSHLGLTNRLLAPAARRVCLAFPPAGGLRGRYRVTGRPIPPPAEDRAAARARFGVPEGERCVLVFGGSLGARSINLASVQAFRRADLHVIHACGERDYSQLAAPGPHYQLRPYIREFSEALAAADLVIARSGGSIFEIAAAGRPAILIPYPHATADHQAANARWMAEAGAAIVIPDGELSAARLAAETGRLLADPSRLAAMSRASAAIARPNAAREVAQEVLAAARRGRRFPGDQPG
jgi:UDP-N-acetylglucosamine--N-acetylmuramyl-(pentapeptide) pyrophosphoryl-undecaprenol N-acetylglucosamine transferase